MVTQEDEVVIGLLGDITLHDLFRRVTSVVGRKPSDNDIGDDISSNEEKLRFYGLFKHSNFGSALSSSEPPIFHPVARSKFLAWKACSSMTRRDAMQEYIKMAASRRDKVGKECQCLIIEFLNNHKNDKSTGKPDIEEECDDQRERKKSNCQGNKITSKEKILSDVFGKQTSAHKSLVSYPASTSTSMNFMCGALEKWTGFHRLVPRGRLDISYSDLAFGLHQCTVKRDSKQDYDRLQRKITSLWTTTTIPSRTSDNESIGTIEAASRIVVGLSVRSLFDLYLTMKEYPDGSEILVVPPVSVPGMMHVARYHNLRIVPVDIEIRQKGKSEQKINQNSNSKWINVEDLQSKVTDKTVSIMIVHPFGMVTTDVETFEKLRVVADKHQLELWEDCAETFTGLGHENYLGSIAHADVRFFSFGTIKTATALGGGIAVLKNNDSAEHMHRIQQSLFYKKQTRREFFRKVITAIVLNSIADSPFRVGILSTLCRFLGLNFDTVVTYSVRGFSLPDALDNPTSTKKQKGTIESGNRWIQSYLIRQIRKRPSCALLALLYRRLEQSKRMAPSVPSRLQRCKKVASLLKGELPDALFPNLSNFVDTFWAFPICCEKRDIVSRKMQSSGFDVATGASQLCSVSKFTDNLMNENSSEESCPTTDNLMNSILYLPICSQELSDSKIDEMIRSLQDALGSPSSDFSNIEHPETKQREKRRSLSSVIALALVLIFNACTLNLSPIRIIQSIIFLITYGFLIRLCGESLLRWTTASLYLEESSAFAEHCDMIDAVHDDKKLTEQNPGIAQTQKIIDSMESLKLSVSPNPARSKRKVILTGATGFVGTALLRDLLLHREILSLEKVILICRNKGDFSARTRIERLINKPIFDFLTKEERTSLVEVMEGDVTLKSAGLSPMNLARIIQDDGISHVIHSAAAVSFTLEFPNAAESNITSSLNMQALSGQLKNKEVQFVHISTAFVHGDKIGSKEAPLCQELFDFLSFDPNEIYKSMIGTQYYASKAMVELGFPNTYSFSKSVCEHLLSQNHEVSTTIIRPSIVGPSIELPYEGWAGDRPSTIVAGPCLHLKNQWNIWHLGKQYATCFPVDLLARFVLAKSFIGDSCPKNSSSDGSSSCDGSFERISSISDESSDFEDIGCHILSKNVVDGRFTRIFNATWDTKTSQHAQFSWVEFSTAYLHLGSVLGYFSRSSAMMQLFLSAQLIPNFKPSIETFRILQSIFIRSPFELVAAIYNLVGLSLVQITKLLAFLDLPLLFYPFVKEEFYFQSDLHVPTSFNSRRYSFSCGVAAHRFISSKLISEEKKSGITGVPKTMSCFPVGGRNHMNSSSYLLWAFCQPRGNFIFRLVAVFVAYLLRGISTIVTVDLISFRKHLTALRSKNENGPVHLVLVPTHRSFLDFILLSYVFFSVPELQVSLPFIVAADDFQQLPFVGWLARRLRAFYIQRGTGRIDKKLSPRLKALKADRIDTTFELFIEGKRSRDRRFIDPKTGLLKSLKHSGGEHVILPITINYECIPEQNILSKEAAGSCRKELNLTGMIFWLRDVFRGKVNIGKVHIVASDPLLLDCKSDTQFKRLVDNIQMMQQREIVVSDYHLRATSKMLDIEKNTLKIALQKLGCRFWPLTPVSDIPELPTDQTTLSTIFFHFGHALAPLFFEKRRKWSLWLNRVCNSNTPKSINFDRNILLLYDRLVVYFDSADTMVKEAVLRLKTKGFVEPDSDHIFQTVKATMCTDVPSPILRAAVLMTFSAKENGKSSPFSQVTAYVTDTNLSDGIEKLGFWGFNDSGFVARTDDRGKRFVTMKGARYALCGKRMFKLLPFIEASLNIKINLSKEFTSMHPRWSSNVESDIATTDKSILGNLVDGHLSFSTLDRLRHGTGHSQEDVFTLRCGADIRIPDVVLWPSSEEQVIAVVDAARRRGWCLIPFGGGTNVIEATRCPSKEIEPRPIISISMKRMKRILRLNEEDGLAHVEAGITGRKLVEFLDRRGYTMGHEPDSIEFSTLGGWIATKASGMKRSKYGNIEDIVVSTRIVNANGVLWKGNENQGAISGRHSEGIDVRTLAFGSEGCLGIITSAVVRVWPLPEVKKFGSIIFPRFGDGLQFLRSLSREPRMMPACVRLLDNAHFRLGQALRPEEPSWFDKARDAMAKSLVSLYLSKDFDPESVVCATISYEGSDGEVREQMATVSNLSRAHGGMTLGSTAGKAGYDLTFMIAYLRDFAMTYHILGESFETFAPWSKIETLIAATKNRIVSEHASRLLPGTPFVGCRVTQLYHEGACLYFYMCINFEGFEDRASAIYTDLERAAREEILKRGGSLSHHHGLGKVRSSFAKTRSSSEFRNVISSIKDSIDKENVFGARNGLFAP